MGLVLDMQQYCEASLLLSFFGGVMANKFHLHIKKKRETSSCLCLYITISPLLLFASVATSLSWGRGENFRD